MGKEIFYICRNIYSHHFARVRMVLFSSLFSVPIWAVDGSSMMDNVESGKSVEAIVNHGMDGVLQSKKVTGKVMDDKGEAIIGANVLEKGTTNGVITDIDGNFTINVNENSVLQVSFIGYVTTEVKVKDASSLTIRLKEDSEMLEEVVVVGYGTQKKVNLTGAVAAVNVDEKIASRSLSNVSSGLSGLIPGLSVQGNTSMAGKDGASLQIRGLGTVNNADPLVVVDGMPDVDLNRINMADVESISVLKDAASASIYGSRAANGVILITTRTGQKGKTSINFNASYAFEDPMKTYDFMADYPRSLTLEQRIGSESNTRENLIFKDGTIDQWMALGMIDPLRYPNTDWTDIIMRNASKQNYSVSATGGNDKSNFFLSVGVMDQKGLQICNDYTRYNTRFNFDYNLFNNVKVGARFDGNWSDFSYSWADGFSEGGSGGSDFMHSVAGVTPYDPETGRYGGAMAYGEDILAFNPYAIFLNAKNTETVQQMNGNLFMDWKVFKGFTAHVDYSLSYHHSFKKQASMPTGKAYNFQSESEIGRYWVPDEAPIKNDYATNYKTQFNARANYETTIANDHHLNVMFVYSEEYWKARNLGAYRNDRIHESTSEIGAALTNVYGNGGGSSSEALRSYVGRFDYNAYDRYLFQFNFRVDGSSKYAKGHRYGFFPSVSAAWRFTEEEFLKDFLSSWLSLGKFRISYGTTGNNSGVGRFEQVETLSQWNYIMGNDQIAKGFANKKMINKDLTWEVSKVFNLGLDLGFLNNRLRVELDYYNRLTTDMIRPSQMSIHLNGAYNAPRRNIGNMRNQGFELNLNWKDKIGQVDYSVSLNGSYNRNILEKWSEFLGRGTTFIDMPYGFIYCYENDGMAQTWEDVYSHTPQGATPGSILRKDLNGDGIIDGKDQRAHTNYLGSRPTTSLGLTLNAAWKGFDVSALFNAAFGRKAYWNTNYTNTNFDTKRYAATWDHWNKPWSLENRDAEWTRIGVGMGGSDYFLQNTDYLRLKNLQVGYNFPKKWLSKISMANLRLYFSAENLFTLTGFDGLDPERPYSGNNLYPTNKSYSLGVNVNF